MKKISHLVFVVALLFGYEGKGQVTINAISLLSTEKINTELCFNNTKLMSGNSINDRYMVYYNPDTIFLSVNQAGKWSKKIAYLGKNIKSATLSVYKDTIWICWKEKPNSNSYIKTLYTPDKGTSWSKILPVSPPGNVSAPSISAASNGKIHFVWFSESPSDTTVYYNVYSRGSFLPAPMALSNASGQGSWPSVITKGDTVLCAWKEKPPPSKVWFSRSFDGGKIWLKPSQPHKLTSTTKDPNLSYARDSASGNEYVYLAFDGQNRIYIQTSTNFGTTWTDPDPISNPKKLSQFAHIECNNKGFVGIAYEQSTAKNIFDDTKKDVGFIYSTSWGKKGTFGYDSLAYAFNGFGSIYPAFSKIDETNFYLNWLSRDTILNITNVYERHLNVKSIAGIHGLNQNSNILIFPNPTNNLVNINIGNEHLQSIKIYNPAGVIAGEYISPQFSVSNLPQGLYYVAVQTNKGCFVSKLIKE